MWKLRVNQVLPTVLTAKKYLSKVLSFIRTSKKKEMGLVILFLMAACSSARWPTEGFIRKYNYQPVIGMHGELRKTDTNIKENNPPMYPGGINGIEKMVSKNLKYPEEARRLGISGKVILSYIIDKDGYVRQVQVIQSADSILDNEAIRVVGLMQRWIPEYKNGRPVRVKYKLPIVFGLTN